MTYTINIPGFGKVEAPCSASFATAPDREVFAALRTPHGFIDPVALQILVDRGLCFRGDMDSDIERRIQRRETRNGS